MNDRIEQQVTIGASLDRVWELVTQPGWWVPTDEEQPIDRTPGHRTVRASEKCGRYIVEVVGFEPQRYVAFRWASEFPGEAPTPSNSTLVEFFVEPVGDVVRVTVVESGFAALAASEEVRASALEANTGGWQEELAGLKARSEEATVA